jgi:hypothetical protein
VPTSPTKHKELEQLTFSWEALPAKVSVSQDSEEDWTTNVATSPLSFAALLTDSRLRGSCGKTSLVSCRQEEDGTLVASSGRWENSGIISRGESWTLKTSEFHKDAGVSFLSDILEPSSEVPQRFCLSSTACRGILRRAEKRGKTLPPLLAQALQQVASENTPKGAAPFGGTEET